MASSTVQARSQDSIASAQSRRQSRIEEKRAEEIRQKKIDNPEAGDEADVYRHSAMVRKLANMFGLSIEVTSRMFEIINFILLAIGIIWLIGKILPKALRNRTERIRNDVERARAATEDANRRLASVEERLARLDTDIETVRINAEQETATEEKRLRAAMEQEKQSILEAAERDIEAAGKNAQNQLKKLAADLVIEHAKRKMTITPEIDQNLMQNFLTGLGRKRPGNGVDQ